MSNDGKLYEELVFNKYMSESTYIDENYEIVRHYRVVKDFKAKDYKTSKKRQVDIAVFVTNNKGERFIAIECKNHNKLIDEPVIESFISKLDNIHASAGIIVSSLGFTESAYILANSCRGITLRVMTPKELEEYLFHDYKFYNGECPYCKGRKNWLGEKILSHVNYYDFVNLQTPKGKYLKIYRGFCDQCLKYIFFNEKCRTSMPIMGIDDGCSEKKVEIPCKDKCGLVYIINKDGALECEYKGNRCIFINSGHVEF